MLKFIIITVIFIYVVFKVSGFILKIFDTLLGRTDSGTGAQSRKFGPEHRRQKYRQPANGNVNIEYIPEEDKKERASKDFRGGEYVDYEEVK